MGVLKVNVGDAVTPDWRNIGCGTGSGTGRLKLYTGSGWVREVCDTDPIGTFTDDFDRTTQTSWSETFTAADQTFTGTGYPNWTGSTNGTVATWGISSNQLYMQSLTGGGQAWLMRDAGAADIDVSVRMWGLRSNATPWFVFRANAATTPSTFWYVSKNFLGNSDLGNVANIIINDGDLVRIVARGSKIQYYVNGVLQYTTTSSQGQTGIDNTYLGASYVPPGTGPVTNTGRWDDFTVLAEPAVTPGADWQYDAVNSPTGPAVAAVSNNELLAVSVPNTADSGFGVYTLTPVGISAADIDMTVTMREVPSNSNTPFLVWRGAADGSGFWMQNNKVSVVTAGAASSTQVGATFGTTIVAGDTVRVTTVGNVHTVYRNGAQVWTATTATNNTATRHGFLIHGAGVDRVTPGNTRVHGTRWDDFTLTDPAVERHPLKVNVGTPEAPDWQTVACMVAP